MGAGSRQALPTPIRDGARLCNCRSVPENIAALAGSRKGSGHDVVDFGGNETAGVNELGTSDLGDRPEQGRPLLGRAV